MNWRQAAGSLLFGVPVAFTLLFAEETTNNTNNKDQLLRTPQQRCMSALDSGIDRSDLAFTIIRKSDQLRVDITVSIPASSISFTKNGDNSEAFLTWFIVQRNQSGKRFREIWKGDIHLNMLLPESLDRFRQDGVNINQRLISSDDANLQITVCDTQSGKVGTQTIPAYEQRSRK